MNIARWLVLIGFIGVVSITTAQTPVLSPNNPVITLENISQVQQLAIWGHGSEFRDVKYSPNGQLLAVASNVGVLVYDTYHFDKEPHLFYGHHDVVMSVDFSSDSRFIVSGSIDRTIRIWDVQTGENIHILYGHTYWVSSVVFSPDGRYIASGGYDATVRIWDAHTGLELKTITGLSETVTSVDFSPDSRFVVSGSIDGSVRVWNVETGESSNDTSMYFNDWVLSVAYSPNGEYIAASDNDSFARVLELDTNEMIGLGAWTDIPIEDIAFSPDSHWVATASGGIVYIWDSQTGERIRTLISDDHIVGTYEIDFSPDGRFLVVTNHRVIRIWYLQTAIQIHEINSSLVNGIAYDADMQHLIVSDRNGLYVLDSQTFEIHNRFNTSTSVFAYDPNGAFIVSGYSNGEIYLWDLEYNQNIYNFVAHTDKVTSLAYSPDGVFVASASDDQHVKIWRLGSPSPEYTLLGHTDIVSSLAFSPDGLFLASAGWDELINLWNVETGELLKTIPTETAIYALAYHPNGRYIASGGWNHQITVWDMQTGMLYRTIQDTGRIQSIAYSPDGKLLAIASIGANSKTNHRIWRIWDAETGRQLRLFLDHVQGVKQVLFSADSRYIITASLDGTIRIWGVPID